jgi:hypothetical protein
MFSKHIHKELSAYCQGELPAEEVRRVSEHLIGCSSCRKDYDQIKLGVKLAEQIPRVQAPAGLWNDLELRAAAHRATHSSVGPSSLRLLLRPRFVAMAAACVLLVSLGMFWLYVRETRPFWDVVSLDGTPQIGTRGIKQKGRLGLGQWLETDSNSRAEMAVSSIGHVEIGPNTRVRLLETKPTEHRLELQHGRLSARIWAPPKLFYVDTPSGVAADLGCAYTLEVDDHGASLLRVTSGWVALQLRDRESMVPAGAACATRPGIGPGTPYFEDASESFQLALRRIDFETEKYASLDVLLVNARTRDTLTLWHLLARVESADRARIYDRMVELAPPPEGVTRADVMALKPAALDAWKEKLESSWTNYSSPTMKSLKKLWSTGLGKINEMEGRK